MPTLYVGIHSVRHQIPHLSLEGLHFSPAFKTLTLSVLFSSLLAVNMIYSAVFRIMALKCHSGIRNRLVTLRNNFHSYVQHQ